MKAIMLMFDSLNRRMLEPYGCDWVQTPNFRRLAERTATFENAYVGSMPCMPARREIHTGRLNFLHRSWGPLEPFDDSMPRLLKEHGVHSHLISDHYHYWEAGGATYHTQYNTWEISRGQEGDPWIADLTGDVTVPETVDGRKGPWFRQDRVNRKHMPREEDQPQPKTFARAEEFLRLNHGADNWFLTVETFDPHEPYSVPQRFQDLYPHEYHGLEFDWPTYRRVQESPEEVKHCRLLSAALHSMCDWYLGRVLDLMDRHRLWDDTLLIVNTDHGFLLGEHDWWAKCVQPFYNEVANMPLFVWDPRAKAAGVRRRSLAQTIDLAPTLLEYFGVERPRDMQGAPLAAAVANDTPVREAGLYGQHGAHVNVTDGRYVYMRAPARKENAPLFNYTLMPTHMRELFKPAELQDVTLAEPFPFTKGCRTLRIPSRGFVRSHWHEFGTLLFDLATDPKQERPIQDAAVEQRMIGHLTRLMKENDAPPEQWARLGL